MSAITEIAEDVHPYGWRDVTTKMPDGTVRFKRIALTLKDCLYPEEGDCMPASPDHTEIVFYLYQVLKQLFAQDPSVFVSSDCMFYWDHPDLVKHSPDIAATFGVKNPDDIGGSFKEADHGARPTVIVEVVSPHTRRNDVVSKVADYHRLGIPYYLIIDQEYEDGPRSLVGYRYEPTGYAPIDPDENGWIWIGPLNLWVEVRDGDVVCYDGTTRQRKLDAAGLTAFAEQSRVLAEKERSLAESERVIAEREKARADAEKVRAEQEKVRADAEKSQAEQANARAEQEKARADAAEAKLRELEAKLAGR